MLTVEERAQVRRLWTGGPAALLDAGFTLESIRAFLLREDVASEMSLLDAELKQGQAIEVRTRHGTRRQLSQLAPGAVALLARAMAGPVYLRGTQGEIVKDALNRPMLMEAELTPTQLRSAEIVLDTLAVGGMKPHESRGDVQLNLLLQSSEKTVTLEVDPDNASGEQQALSRERMRNTIDILLKRLPDVRKRVEVGLALPPKETPSTTVSSKPLPTVVRRKPPVGKKNGVQKGK